MGNGLRGKLVSVAAASQLINEQNRGLTTGVNPVDPTILAIFAQNMDGHPVCYQRLIGRGGQCTIKIAGL